MKNVDINVLVGKMIAGIEGLKQYSNEVLIHTVCGATFTFYHDQNCCECVTLEDYCLDSELEGAWILKAEKVCSNAEDDVCESGTWTFYKIETDKGGLWMRWLGESNGYYGEGVDISASKT
jgi:hypothetical protein